MQVQCLGREDLLEEILATHFMNRSATGSQRDKIERPRMQHTRTESEKRMVTWVQKRRIGCLWLTGSCGLSLPPVRALDHILLTQEKIKIWISTEFILLLSHHVELKNLKLNHPKKGTVYLHIHIYVNVH